MRTTAALLTLSALSAMGCGSDALHAAEEGPAAVGPVTLGPGVRVFSGRAAVLTDGGACTGEPGAQGDRWCGFVAFASDDSRSLYVVNVSQLLAGVRVTCDAPDPNCILLTSRVGSSAANFHPTGFAGDTLVYYDQSVSPYLWRPGMERGRLLMQRNEDADVIFCSPAPVGPSVGCLSVPRDQLSSVVLADIYAGRADAESEPLLQRFESVIWANIADVGAANRFRWGFPGVGNVAWSSPERGDGPEILKLARVDQPSSVTSIATNVHYWKTSGDGSAWFWLRGADARGKGLLQTAAFPDGVAKDVRPEVRDYALAAGELVAALTAEGELVSISTSAPTLTQRVIDEGVMGLIAVSNGQVAYAKTIAGGNVGDLFLATLDGSRRCLLDGSVNVPLNSIHFAEGKAAAVWALQNGDAYDAYHTRLSDCATEPLAPGVSMLSWVGSSTVLFVDRFDSASASGALSVRSVTRAAALDTAAPAHLAEHVGSYGVMGPVLLYAVNGGAEGDGVYVRAFAR